MLVHSYNVEAASRVPSEACFLKSSSVRVGMHVLITVSNLKMALVHRLVEKAKFADRTANEPWKVEHLRTMEADPMCDAMGYRPIL